MTKSLLLDAFRHHVWATLRLVDTCLTLTPEQMETAVPGTYGSILDTLRHIVEGDAWDIHLFTGDSAAFVHGDGKDLVALRAEMEAYDSAWSRIVEKHVDPDVTLREVDPDDGFERDASVGIRLAGALHHGTEHRTQICTTLTALGIQPPDIQVWDFGLQNGLVAERWPSAS